MGNSDFEEGTWEAKKADYEIELGRFADPESGRLRPSAERRVSRHLLFLPCLLLLPAAALLRFQCKWIPRPTLGSYSIEPYVRAELNGPPSFELSVAVCAQTYFFLVRSALGGRRKNQNKYDDILSFHSGGVLVSVTCMGPWQAVRD